MVRARPGCAAKLPDMKQGAPVRTDASTIASTPTTISLELSSSLHARLLSRLHFALLATLLATLLDKAVSGDLEPVYGIGESLRIGVEVSESAWVYLVEVRPNGQITQLIPNRFDDAGTDNFLRPGQTKYFPPRDARYAFSVAGPHRLSKVLAVASKQQLVTRQLATFESGEMLARSDVGQDASARARSMVIRPVDPGRWLTDTALYYVGERPRPSAFGTISIRSDPNNAEAYVDGEFVG